MKTKGLTETFALSEGTFTPPVPLEDDALIGFIVGAAVTGLFILVAMFLIIRNECQRHKDYEKFIAKYKKTLNNEFGYSNAQVQQLEDEFE